MQGRPVLMLIHCDLGRQTQWHRAIHDLQDEFSIVTFDRRGHGESESPGNGSFDHRQEAEDVSAVADALGLDRLIMAAHSGGAFTALSYAAAQPTRVAGILFVDPAPDPSVLPAGALDGLIAALEQPGYEAVVEGYYRSMADANDETVAQVVADAVSSPQTTAIGSLRALSAFDPKRPLHAYSGPMLSLIQPQFDIEGALHRLGSGFDHAAVPNPGHWVHLDAPAAFNNAVRNLGSRL
jgi:pimeloyl-ACP methyl ester carboxylesterase